MNNFNDSKAIYLVQQPVIGFDMGGTLTDVSHYDGLFEHIFETLNISGVTIQALQIWFICSWTRECWSPFRTNLL
ncbi:Hydantoinase/oxoprolinase [Cinara cedri]|uniref:Hydantoinase/oxoprolinase n=1 Tax=Cinara cedri TaxID=506608 RepID=A0A5E4M9Z9_9HEMI|nr:Hydantoinase/oxoprolinase [Cinara cedri]